MPFINSKFINFKITPNVIDTYGARVSVQNKCFAIVKEEESRIISPHRVLAIWISKTARVSTRVFQLAAEFSIPVLILGKQLIWIQNNSNQNNALLLRQQVYFSHSIEAFYFIQQNILNKIKEQLKVILPFEKKEEHIKKSIERIQRVVSNILSHQEKILVPTATNDSEYIESLYIRLQSKEAHASKYYWKSIDMILGDGVDFEQRQKRGATDKFNVTLNYVYSFLYSTITQAIITLKLSPYIGLMHSDRVGNTSLSFDLIERYRAYIDALVLRMFQEEILLESHFRVTTLHTTIDKTGRKLLAEAYFKLMNKKQLIDGVKISILSHILQQVQELHQLILKYKRHEK